MDKAALLKDLRKQVTSLEDDLRAGTEPGQQFHAKLKGEYDRAREHQRTALTFGQWRDDRVTQAAVAWILATVFVRFCEDNDLIAEPWIAGPGDRLAEADERHQRFFRDHPEKNDRDWLIAAFEHLAATNETVAGLFDRDHNPLWEMKPSYEQAADLLKFWRRLDADGQTVHDFTDKEDLDTRFLGDLYQDLSDHAKKTYALLQTPEFVEEFILDLTLEPAIEEFGLEPAWKHKPAGWPGDEPVVRGLRTIDPACGSGHFLLGIFHRLLEKWKAVDVPGLDDWGRIRRVMESIHGCDKNPFAAEIARFRLLVAALHAAGETRLDAAPAFPINVAVGDSLLHGRGAGRRTEALFGQEDQFTYATEDVKEFENRSDLLGMHSYHVVVGNPPYITAYDSTEKSNYKRAYKKVCHGLWTLAVPFVQRMFDLAILSGGHDRQAGFAGQITSNAFMRREYGERLVVDYLPTVALTHVVDTSGAFIPGHGTPTVILVGRNRIPFQREPIRAALGVQGEPGQPTDPASGMVWRAIVDQLGTPGSESKWVSVDDLDRRRFSFHPWSLSGGGAGELVEVLNSAPGRLGSKIMRAGFYGDTHADEAFTFPAAGRFVRRARSLHAVPSRRGDQVRDWSYAGGDLIAFPYDEEKKLLPEDVLDSYFLKEFWPLRTELWSRSVGRGTYRSEDRKWWSWHQLPPDVGASELSIVYGEVATHNHFVLDRGSSVFNRTAPVIKLPRSEGEDTHLTLLGLLNSSASCFWLKQVCHDKGSQSGTGGFMHDEWERFYQYNASKLLKFPLPSNGLMDNRAVLDIISRLHATARATPDRISSSLTRTSLDALASQEREDRQHAIALQEELDWRIYASYGLLAGEEIVQSGSGDLNKIPAVELGERAFEIVLARKVEAGEATTVWFERHGSTPVTEIPERWPEEYRRVVQARIDLIEKLPKGVGLIERPEYKRRWATEPWEKKEKAALRNWILDRCEREDLWHGLRDGYRQPRTLTVNQLADQFKDDADMQSVAALYASDHMKKHDLPLAKVLAEVIADEHVPYLAALRYKDTGLRKRAEWEQVWDLQREEDRTGKRLDIAVPPKYAPKDFQKTSYWSQRGKLDVPKERFTSYPGASPDADDTLLLGWAGWDHKDQAQALANLVNDRAEVGAWDAEKLTPLLAGLLEVLPWVKQWHGEHDPDWGGVPAEEFEAFLREQLGRYELSEQDLKAWRPPTKARGRKKA
ncbi:BREX-2 system adenine-specific DNA-methyltransferase PglX [Actinomadura coerulea]|uniref:BREX-2 system adenine-specific DNA-methyltransferase PglX n=1 Tax=Actinomadura coerulea TaxID=46159 RepID=UPI003446B9FD